MWLSLTERTENSAFTATAFAQDTLEAAGHQWRQVADPLRPKLPKLASLIDEAEPEVGIFPNEAAIRRLMSAILLEQNDEWAVQRAHYMPLKTMSPMSDDDFISLPAMAT